MLFPLLLWVYMSLSASLKLQKWGLDNVLHCYFVHRHVRKLPESSLQMGQTYVPALSLYTFSEPSNCHLKKQKWFARSYPTPDISKTPQIVFFYHFNRRFLSSGCMWRAKNGAVRTACHEDSVHELNIFCPCLWTKWQHKTSENFTRSLWWNMYSRCSLGDREFDQSEGCRRILYGAQPVWNQ